MPKSFYIQFGDVTNDWVEIVCIKTEARNTILLSKWILERINQPFNDFTYRKIGRMGKTEQKIVLTCWSDWYVLWNVKPTNADRSGQSIKGRKLSTTKTYSICQFDAIIFDGRKKNCNSTTIQRMNPVFFTLQFKNNYCWYYHVVEVNQNYWCI